MKESLTFKYAIHHSTIQHSLDMIWYLHANPNFIQQTPELYRTVWFDGISKGGTTEYFWPDAEAVETK